MTRALDRLRVFELPLNTVRLEAVVPARKRHIHPLQTQPDRVGDRTAEACQRPDAVALEALVGLVLRKVV